MMLCGTCNVLRNYVVAGAPILCTHCGDGQRAYPMPEPDDTANLKTQARCVACYTIHTIYDYRRCDECDRRICVICTTPPGRGDQDRYCGATCRAAAAQEQGTSGRKALPAHHDGTPQRVTTRGIGWLELNIRWDWEMWKVKEDV